MKNYIITYTIYDNAENILKTGKMNVKNKLNEMDARVKLEIYLKSKNRMMKRLIIHECEEYYNIFNEILGNFPSNPFRHF